MEDIWKRIMKDLNTVRFEQAEFFSPYCESVIGSILPSEDGTDLIRINAFYRYDRIFQQFLAEQGERAEDGGNVRAEQTEKLLYDYLMHLLVRLEVRNGVTQKELRIRSRMKQLEEGRYGERVQSSFRGFEPDLKYKTAFYLVQQERTGESVALFGKVLCDLLSDGVLYKHEINDRELLFYLGRKKRPADTGIIAAAEELFLPFLYTLRVFYETPFGVIENQHCMNINEIEIF